MEIFGHRGACGYRPENTMESFALAFEQGADAIEFDVVLTSDSVPVILHDLELSSTTTDRSGRKVFEITAAELAQLRAKERYPAREVSASFDGQFQIPTLRQLLDSELVKGRKLILELKSPEILRERGLDLVSAVIAELNEVDLQELGVELVVESFDRQALSEFASGYQGSTNVFLVEPATAPVGGFTDQYLSDLKAEFDGISMALPMLFEGDVVSRAKSLGLLVFGYTFRMERLTDSAESDLRTLFELGLDGLFADQPDAALEVLAGL